MPASTPTTDNTDARAGIVFFGLLTHARPRDCHTNLILAEGYQP